MRQNVLNFAVPVRKEMRGKKNSVPPRARLLCSSMPCVLPLGVPVSFLTRVARGISSSLSSSSMIFGAMAARVFSRSPYATNLSPPAQVQGSR